MALSESQCYTIINTPELSDIYNEMKLKKDLGKCGSTFTVQVCACVRRAPPDIHTCLLFCCCTEQGDENVQIETLKKVIKLLLNGERLPGLLMTIIRFVMPSQNHTIKKLLLIFWEIVPKTTPDGKLLQEMILVCDAYRKVNLPRAHIQFRLLRFGFQRSIFVTIGFATSE